MATISITKCDGCGKEKKDKDCWFSLQSVETLKDGPVAILGTRVAIDAVLQNSLHKTMEYDLCSHACYHRKIDELLGMRGIGRPKRSRNKAKQPETAQRALEGVAAQ